MNSSSSVPDHQAPYWRLSGFYFFYFALVGGLYTYWSLYLQDAGYSMAEIGTLMSSLLLTKIIAPNIWGWLGDRTQKRLFIVRLGAFLTLAIFACVLLRPTFLPMLLIILGFSFFWNAILPQYEVVTLDHLDGNMRRYTRIRLWGSIGFIVTSAGLGWFFDRYAVSLLPYLLLGLMAFIWITAQSLYEKPIEHHSEHQVGSFLQQLFRLPVLVFFGLAFLMQLTHGPYHGFFVLYLTEFGYSKFQGGLLIGLAVFSEVLAFIWVYRLFDRFSIKTLGVVCFLLAAVRWWVTAVYPDYPALMVLVQCTHAATFGVFHAVAINLIQRYFSKRTQGQGQALYGAMSFGAGGALGMYFSGQVWDTFGPQSTFLTASVVAGVGAVIALWKLGEGTTIGYAQGSELQDEKM